MLGTTPLFLKAPICDFFGIGAGMGGPGLPDEVTFISIPIPIPSFDSTNHRFRNQAASKLDYCKRCILSIRFRFELGYKIVALLGRQCSPSGRNCRRDKALCSSVLILNNRVGYRGELDGHNNGVGHGGGIQ